MFLCSLFFVELKADSWYDPEWEVMLYSSDAIALVEYTTEGDFRAKAKVIKLFKGSLAETEIHISGFSNRYGPIDMMSVGDRYVVFLNKVVPSENKRFLQDSINKRLGIAHKDIESENKYRVWSPTSGDLKVTNGLVQYDLLQSTYYKDQVFYDLEEFETFLKACSKINRQDFHNKTLAKIKANPSHEYCAQYLMMLQLSAFSSFDPVFETIANETKPESSYALAKLLGVMDGDESSDVLEGLLSIDNSMVQAEVVRQIANRKLTNKGAILLEHLDKAGEEGFDPNLMNPVMNSIDGGKTEIIKALGELRYKPAIPKLVSLLDTEDDYTFELIIDVLNQLDNKEYIPYLNKHLKNGTGSLIYEICSIISKEKLEECKPALKYFISHHNRDEYPTYEHTINIYNGIAVFKDQETTDFLVSDFETFLSNKDTINSRHQENWINQYIQTFSALKAEEARLVIYKSIFDWHGLNIDFGRKPELFYIKNNLEDSLKEVFAQKFDDKLYKLNHVIAFITNTNEVVSGAVPKSEFLIEVRIPYIKDKKNMGSVSLNELSNELSIPQKNIYLRFDNGWYYIDNQLRFDTGLSNTPLFYFLEYAKKIPNSNDLLFLKEIMEHDLLTEEYEQRKFTEAIEFIEDKLNE